MKPLFSGVPEPRDMFAEFIAARGRMAEGWVNSHPCGRMVWFAWRPSEHRAIRCERDGVTPHQCVAIPPRR